MTRAFPAAGLDIVLLGENRGELGGSEYLKTMHGLVRGVPPALDLARERALQRLLVDLAARGLVAIGARLRGRRLAVDAGRVLLRDRRHRRGRRDRERRAADGGVDRLAATLFGESASRVLVSVDPMRLAAVLDAARAAGVPAARIGRTGGRMHSRWTVDGQVAIDLCGVLKRKRAGRRASRTGSTDAAA